MKIQIMISVALLALLGSCRSQQPEKTMSGFVDGGTSMHCLVLNGMDGDVPETVSFAIDDDTRINGGGLIEGNIAQVTYRPAEKGVIATAAVIETDATYPEVLGRWTTPEGAELPVTIELCVCGEVIQTLPTEVLTFTRWQLEGTEDTITLFGKVVIRSDEPKSYEFTAKAVVTKKDGRKILTVKTDDGMESELYFVE